MNRLMAPRSIRFPLLRIRANRRYRRASVFASPACLGLGVFAALFLLQPLSSPQDRPILYPRVGHHFGVVSVAFSPDGHRLISADADGKLKVWDLASGQL